MKVNMDGVCFHSFQEVQHLPMPVRTKRKLLKPILEKKVHFIMMKKKNDGLIKM